MPVTAESSSSGYRSNGSLVATISVPLSRRTGNSECRCEQPMRKQSQQRIVDRRLRQVDVVQAHLFADGPQGLLLADQSQVDGDLIEPRAVVLRGTRLCQLALVEQPASQQYFSGFHVSSVAAGGFEAG